MNARDVLAKARSKGIQIATAESCTGGLIAAALTEIPGSSDVVDRGFITYSNAAKTEMLGVNPDTLSEFGAVSEPTAIEMAEGALQCSAAQLTVSVTGIAGPGGSDHKPEGMVCFAIAQEGRAPYAETVQFGALGRSEVRKAAVAHALIMLTAVL